MTNIFFHQSGSCGSLWWLLAGIFLPLHVSWAKQPTERCREAWGNHDYYQYDFSQDPLVSSSENITGNFGYVNYQKRVEANPSLPVKRSQCKKEWTILVYMAANNDLSPYAFWDLYEMEAAFSQPRAASTITTDLLVDVQTSKNSDLRRLHMFQGSTQFDRKKPLADFAQHTYADVASPVAYYQQERTLAPKDQLYDFIAWGIENYPAEHYMVIVWGHGQGFAADTVASVNTSNLFTGRFGGLAFQDHSTEFLTTPALAQVLKDVESDIFFGKDKIDIYASDACLMQMAEVAFEIAPYTRYIIGSAQIQSYLGFPYRRMLWEINEGRYNFAEDGEKEAQCGEDKACYLATMLPNLSRQSFDQRGNQGIGDPHGYKRMTMSTLSAPGLAQHLPTAMDKFSAAMLNFLEHADNQEKQDIAEVFSHLLVFEGDSRDINISLNRLSQYLLSKDDWSPAENQLWQAIHYFGDWLSSVALANAFGQDYFDEGYHLLGFKGISIWIPRSLSSLDSRIEDFNDSRLYQKLKKDPLTGKTLWESWLREFFKLKKDDSLPDL